jgi:drug/metabolite transporter (DMT)-like permease
MPPVLTRVRSPDAAGVGFTFLTVSAYASMDVTAKLAYRSGLNVPTLLVVRFIGAGLMLLLLGRALGVGPLPSRRRVFRLLALGAVGYATESFFLNAALHRMAVGPVILIFYAYPSIVAVTALVIGREGMSPLKLTALILSIVGVSILLSFPTKGMNAPGVLLALGAAVAFAAYALVAERAIEGVSKLLFSGFVLLGAGASIGAVGASFGAVHLGMRLALWGWILLHVLLISVAVVSFMGAITRLGASRAAIGNTLEPAVAVILATIILGERLGPFQILGGLLLVVAIALLPLAGRATAGRTRIPVVG